MPLRSRLQTSFFVFILLLTSFFVFEDLATAEPWIATRFAQNCAGCHAPGRYNLPPKDRRCTLSCQGCHTNPNGGGMRNFYGKWTSDRWLRSYNWEQQGKKKERPLPWFAQHYISEKQASEAMEALENWGVKKPSRKSKSKKRRKSQSTVELDPKTIPKTAAGRKLLATAIKTTKRMRSKKSRFVYTESDYNSFDFSEWYYERANGDNNWVPEAKTKKKFESTIPYNDPYFQKKREEVHVGVDMRYFARVPIDNPDENAKTTIWPMALDVGLQYKPFIRKYDNLSLVVETRYFNGPTNTSADYLTTSSVVNRSTYVLIDDAIFNSFFMYGVYKPMFEHYTPDHTTLAQNILYNGGGYGGKEVLHKALTIGLAPNVPFFNITMVQPMVNKTINQDEGIIANLGARWVTLGASLILSYRNTNDKATDDNLNTTAYSLSGGMAYKNFILNLETLNVTKEFAPGSVDSGSIFTTELRYKVWKESYIELVTEVANVTALFGTTGALKEGEASQMSLGYRFFPVAGVDLSMHYRTTSNKPKGGTQFELTEGLVQAHLYF